MSIFLLEKKKHRSYFAVRLIPLLSAKSCSILNSQKKKKNLVDIGSLKLFDKIETELQTTVQSQIFSFGKVKESKKKVLTLTVRRNSV